MSIASALKKAASAAIKATGGSITYRRVRLEYITLLLAQ